LSTGGIIRQHREKAYNGTFLKKQVSKRSSAYTASKEMTSAFDRNESYELTSLGEQFVHYAMTDLPPKIEYNPSQEN
jgi:hypothetical protein